MRLLLKNAAQVLQVVDDRRPFLRGEQEMKNLALIENGSIVVDAERVATSFLLLFPLFPIPSSRPPFPTPADICQTEL